MDHKYNPMCTTIVTESNNFGTGSKQLYQNRTKKIKKSNITEIKVNKNNINIQNNGRISKNDIHSIVQTNTQVHCSPSSTSSRDTKNIKSKPSTITNFTAANFTTRYHQNIFSYVSPNTVVTRINHVESFNHDNHTVLPSKSPEAMDDPT